MDEAAEIERAIAGLRAAGRVEVREDGKWLAGLDDFQSEVRSQGKRTMLHLWSAEQNLVRTVLRVAESSAERLVLEVRRFGRSKPMRIELAVAGAPRPAGRRAREIFAWRFRQFLAEQFPDERVESLTAAADLEHSFSGRYVRGVLRRGQHGWAVLGVPFGEDAATTDDALTFGLLWLDWSRDHARHAVIESLRLFVPEGRVSVVAERMRGLGPAAKVELFELDESEWRARRADAGDAGNLNSWLVPRRELDETLEQAEGAIRRMRMLAAQGIDAVALPGTAEVAVRFRGLEFARWRAGRMMYELPEAAAGAGRGEGLSEASLEGWMRFFETHRNAEAADKAHPVYRAQAERWLESMVLAGPAAIDAHLDPRFLYRQVPVFTGIDRGVMDLLGVTREGRLAVIELKAAEEINLVLQGMDYWLRVRAHQLRGEFERFGYFPGVALQTAPPLLYLVAPGLQFHPATDTLLRYLSPEVQVVRVGLNESWRRGLQVVFRQ